MQSFSSSEYPPPTEGKHDIRYKIPFEDNAMNYIKKMCILRQIRQGFSGDGKTLSGLIKIEQYGKNLAVEVSVINFAPLVSGEYYCLLSDGKGKTEMLTLRGKSLFNLLSDLDVSEGFCGIICYVKNEVVPIAYGINGNKSYDWRSILNATLPPVFPNIKEEFGGEIARTAPSSQNDMPRYELAPAPIPESTPTRVPAPVQAPPEKAPNEPERMPQPSAPPTPKEETAPPISPNQPRANGRYDDEKMATENYYEEKEDERVELSKTQKNARTQSTNQSQRKKKRSDGETDEDVENVCHPFETDPDGYYLSVKEEVDRLFKTYPQDKTLNGAFSCSEWVRVQGTAKAPDYLVGVLKTDGRVRYICYALRAHDQNNPPEEIKNVCTFVPLSPYEESGYFVIFQSAATGECIPPNRA